ncbi:hypothetical protein LX81_01359 [Palleronia aestuarii]|uniref:Lipoprotein n=1 Tax=Palleronia aestuarii TaxID=568105 RepID=A0A2W7NLV5_9RHOB|nr:hypothetical protein [Palleronia aestuarii]PZX17634.1 hypothetical protein LX81_01359 [Palleronia aestuarii]
MPARLLLLVLIVAISGCDRLPTGLRSAFGAALPQEALPYRATLRRDGRRDPNFTVLVNAGGAGLAQIRESVRYPGTVYCLRTFGTSEITWQAVGSPENWVGVPAGSGRLAFRGRCNFR